MEAIDDEYNLLSLHSLRHTCCWLRWCAAYTLLMSQNKSMQLTMPWMRPVFLLLRGVLLLLLICSYWYAKHTRCCASGGKQHQELPTVPGLGLWVWLEPTSRLKHTVGPRKSLRVFLTPRYNLLQFPLKETQKPRKMLCPARWHPQCLTEGV